jgi:hypothetical protein
LADGITGLVTGIRTVILGGADPEPANKGEYLERAIDAGLAAVPDRPLMSEDRFRRRDGAWPQKDLRSEDDILREIPRWATRGVAAIYGRLLGSGTEASDTWPNQAAIKAVIESINE